MQTDLCDLAAKLSMNGGPDKARKAHDVAELLAWPVNCTRPAPAAAGEPRENLKAPFIGLLRPHNQARHPNSGRTYATKVPEGCPTFGGQPCSPTGCKVLRPRS